MRVDRLTNSENANSGSITTFGFYELSRIKRSNSVLTSSSTRLNSKIDLKLDYIDQEGMKKTPKQFLIEAYKNNVKSLKTKQNSIDNSIDNDKIKRQPASSLGFNSNYKPEMPVSPTNDKDKVESGKNKIFILNKLFQQRDLLPEKLISKEDCKSYYKQLRNKKDSEKAEIINMSQGLRDENRCKFDYRLKVNNQKQTNSIKRANAPNSVIHDAFETSAQPIKNILRSESVMKNTERFDNTKLEINRDTLPKLLNSIRLTNFSNAFNEKRRPYSFAETTKNFCEKNRKVSSCDIDEIRSTLHSPDNPPTVLSNNSTLESKNALSEPDTEAIFEIKLDEKILCLRKDIFDEESYSSFGNSSISVSTLDSDQKRRYKTPWPSIPEIENILGVKIKPPEPPKPVEIVPENDPVLDAKGKGKKSATLKKKELVKPASAKRKSALKSAGSGEQDKKETSGKTSVKIDDKVKTLTDNNQISTTTIANPDTPISNQVIDATNITPVTITEQLVSNEQQNAQMYFVKKQLENKIINELPSPLCPSSLKFSKKLGVRIWIENTRFERSLKTTPLI